MQPRILIQLHGYENPQKVISDLIYPVIRGVCHDHGELFPKGIVASVEFVQSTVLRLGNDETCLPGKHIVLVCTPFDGHRLITAEFMLRDQEVLVQHLDSWKVL